MPEQQEMSAAEDDKAFQRLVEALGVAVYTTDAHGRVTRFNDIAVELWGRRPAIGVDQWCGSWRIYDADGNEMPLDQCPMAVTLREDRAVRNEQIIIERPDGSRRTVLPCPTPIHNASGRLTGAVNILIDVTEQVQAETARHESERRYREIFEVAGAALLEADFCVANSRIDLLKGQGVEDFRAYLADHLQTVDELIDSVRITDLNQEALRLFEAGEKTQLLDALPKLLTPDAQDTFVEIVVALAEGRKSMRSEALLQTLNGKQRHVAFTISFTHPDDFGSVLVSLMDITERKRAESALSVSEQRYREIFEMAGVALLEADFSAAKSRIDILKDEGVRDFRADLTDHLQTVDELINSVPIVDMNQEALRLFDAGEKTQLLDALPKLLTPEAQDVFVDLIVVLAEGHKAMQSEATLQTLNTEQRHVAFTISFTHPDNFGSVLISLMDITERKRAEEAMFMLSAIVESSDDAIVSKDLNGIIRSWNAGAERLLGYTAEETIGKSMRMIIPPDRQYEEDEVLSNIRAGGRVEHFDTVRMRKDGSLVDVSIAVSPLRDSAGRTIGASNVARDISDRKAAEEALMRSMDIKDQFLSLVSHELRTPIATIVGNALVLLRRGDVLDEEDRRQALADVATEGERLQQIIENLLLLTRLEAGRPLDLEPLLPARAAEEGIQSFQRRSPSRQVILTVDGVESAVALAAPPMISLVLENLLSNADKYSPLDQAVEVLLRQGQDACVEVRVRDHGIGLKEAEINELFTPFYRSESAKKQAKGMGIGLAVCKRIIEAHGGKIWAENHADGGAEFAFTLKLESSAVSAPI